jgi:hypothetical protein
MSMTTGAEELPDEETDLSGSGDGMDDVTGPAASTGQGHSEEGEGEGSVEADDVDLQGSEGAGVEVADDEHEGPQDVEPSEDDDDDDDAHMLQQLEHDAHEPTDSALQAMLAAGTIQRASVFNGLELEQPAQPSQAGRSDEWAFLCACCRWDWV